MVLCLILAQRFRRLLRVAHEQYIILALSEQQ